MQLQERIRFSHLKQFGRSAAHYKHAVTHGRDDTPSLRTGRLVDLLLFEGAPLIFDGASRRGKAWDAFAAEHAGRDIYLASEVEDAKPMVDAIIAHELAYALLTDGRRQETIMWEWLGRKCSGTPDIWTPGRLVDLKTTRNADPSCFGRDAIRYAYHAQLAWYRNALRITGKADPEDCYIVSVESSAPYPIVILRLTESILERGEASCAQWMARLEQCERANRWPGYTDEVIEFDGADSLGGFGGGDE